MRRLATLAVIAAGSGALLATASCVGDSPVNPPPGADGGDTDAPVTLTDVTGKVVDEVLQPLAGAAVQIGGAIATTDANGTFTLQAPPSYVVSIVYPSTSTSSGKRVVVFEGITSRTPTLQVTYSRPTFSASTVHVTFTTPQDTPLGSDERFLINVAGDKSSNTQGFVNGGAVPPLDIPGNFLTWFGANPLTGKAYALRFKMPSNAGSKGVALPASLESFSSAPSVSLTDGASETIDFGAPLTIDPATISGTIDYGSWKPGSLRVTYRPPGAIADVNLLGAWSDTTFSVPAISIANQPKFTTGVAVLSDSSDPKGANAVVWNVGLAANTANVALKLPDPITATAPDDGATGVDSSSTFSWSPSTRGGGYILTVSCDTPVKYEAMVLTGSTSATLPDTSALGSALPPGDANCHWFAAAFEGLNASTVVGPSGWRRFTGLLQSDANGSYVSTPVRGFTAK